ncbi:methyltransferase domain-containing protein [Kitasatospora sp. NPDC097643]|uniref:class I SAM-dependent methyltransferase n=1 Tax=Kitasatospora sp. NPDC097643 TaxID=3157230 RepID=UPI00332DA3F9
MTTPWTGASGRAWADSQSLLENLFRPVEDLLLSTLTPDRTTHLLDVGCGTGGTTVAAARRLGPTAHCTGVDISAPMLDAANARLTETKPAPTPTQEAGHVDFLLADAQTHPFPPSTYDTIVSRFGVMFFDDPVAAFANLRRAATPGAALRLLVWRDAADNPFMTTAERAAAPLLPQLPPRRPDAPGQFAFADPDKVRRILTSADWTNVDLQPVDVPCALPEPGLVPYFTRLGPVGLALAAADDDEIRARVVETVRPAFDPFVHGDEVRFTAALWLITATR